MIFREGAQSSFYYQLVSGEGKVGKYNNEGREFIQTIIEPGECFGEFPLFDDEPFCGQCHCR
ncbi:MAG: Crp/Fnr family transcriptional regulator [Chitinophagaceae bacterium]|nr:Crp/Fnr family transcriptional regulator [Chitinophagaceae bacterium]